MRNSRTKAVLNILRQAQEPMTAQDIALELLVQRTTDWRGSLDTVAKAIIPTLQWYRGQGVLASERDGPHVLWRVAR
jgi:hypothetical protein